jgi:YfiH family protein
VITDHDDHWVWTVDGARAVFTSRELGNIGLHVGDDPAVVLEHRRRAAALAGLGIERVAGVTQVHGADVWLDLAHADQLPAAVRWSDQPSPIEADALVSTRPGIALAIGVADCLPIAISWGSAITAIHAGWRSLDAGVIEQALAVLRRQAGSAVALADAPPRAVIGPALGACCMEVGDEVAARFDARFVQHRDGATRPFLDARADAASRLQSGGCVVEHVHVCTRCDPRMFSHRGDEGLGGRQALLMRRT